VESIRFEFLVDPSNPVTRFSKEFFIFKDGNPEEYNRWLMGYCDLVMCMPLKEPSDRIKMLRTMLKGCALSLFLSIIFQKDVVMRTLRQQIRSS
jgi:hypothetical protein